MSLVQPINLQQHKERVIVTPKPLRILPLHLGHKNNMYLQIPSVRLFEFSLMQPANIIFLGLEICVLEGHHDNRGES